MGRSGRARTGASTRAVGRTGVRDHRPRVLGETRRAEDRARNGREGSARSWGGAEARPDHRATRSARVRPIRRRSTVVERFST